MEGRREQTSKAKGTHSDQEYAPVLIRCVKAFSQCPLFP
uniref:Uncharacterized protein n=1 Tax=Arundo donax TaxID=35708 RepID=A0A0A8ZIF6_ARUDO